MLRTHKSIFFALFSICLFLTAFLACKETKEEPPELNIPRGYTPVIEIQIDDRLVGFGPFVGYYFRPESPGNLNRIQFVCFNERSFYTRDLPENTQLFEGDAVLTRLTDVNRTLPASNRINPVYFQDAPLEWLEQRPEPEDEFLHFHSCYDSRGPVLDGYWIRHKGSASFTYDMGGRVDVESPLYHEVNPGIDKHFARIIEFDRGPE